MDRTCWHNASDKTLLDAFHTFGPLSEYVFDNVLSAQDVHERIEEAIQKFISSADDLVECMTNPTFASHAQYFLVMNSHDEYYMILSCVFPSTAIAYMFLEIVLSLDEPDPTESEFTSFFTTCRLTGNIPQLNGVVEGLYHAWAHRQIVTANQVESVHPLTTTPIPIGASSILGKDPEFIHFQDPRELAEDKYYVLLSSKESAINSFYIHEQTAYMFQIVYKPEDNVPIDAVARSHLDKLRDKVTSKVTSWHWIFVTHSDMKAKISTHRIPDAYNSGEQSFHQHLLEVTISKPLFGRNFDMTH